MTNKTPYLRKKKFINQDVQGRIIMQSFVFAFFTLFIFAGVLLYMSSDNLVIAYDQQHLQVSKSTPVLLMQMLQSNWISLVVAGLSIIIVSITQTHRLVGPMYRYEQALRALRRKDLHQHVALREKDDFKELADYINDFTRILSVDLHKIEQSCRYLDQAVCLRDMAGVDKSVRDIRSVLNEYTLKSGGH